MCPTRKARGGSVGEEGDPEHQRAEDARHEDHGDPGIAGLGGRKMLTPLEMASVPVSADPPEAKARRTTKRVAP